MSANEETTLDVAVIGAGWAGMLMLHRLRELGMDVRVYEAGAGIGGTWFWNRYPGARCDIPILNYSYSFSEDIYQEWEWTEHYAAQPEIERYANYVADKLDLRRDIQLNTRVDSATYDETTNKWLIETDQGDRVRTTFLVMATGGYSAPITPAIDGLDSFEGEIYFTAQWPQESVDFATKRIGVVGTGSSGMQTITAISKEDTFEQLYVFQRTANFMTYTRNQPIDPQELSRFKTTYSQFWERARQSGAGIVFDHPAAPVRDLSDEEFEQHMNERWKRGGPAALAGITNLQTDALTNDRVAEYLRARVREKVSDPRVAELLCAKGHYVGTKRMLHQDGYLDAFNKPNVTLVDIRNDPIRQITPKEIMTETDEYPLDMIIFATGFDSGTGAMLRIDITGRRGIQLSEKWSAGPRTYLGLMVTDFPNLFSIAGPGSPSIRSNVILSIEQHVEWTADLVAYIRDHEIDSVEPSDEAEEAWTVHVAQTADSTLLGTGENQYVGSNVSGKPRVMLAYLGGINLYRKICDQTAQSGYEGFLFSREHAFLPAVRQWSGPPTGALTKYGNPIV